jgi:hypothetical protein
VDSSVARIMASDVAGSAALSHDALFITGRSRRVMFAEAPSFFIASGNATLRHAQH